MTYLSCPRLHFAGTFAADPSTVNNVADRYDTATFDRATDWLPTGDNWNPDGRHAFRLENTTVRSAVGAGGVVAGDPVVGLQVRSRGAKPAKLVDLDTDQQMVSMIFGLRLALVDSAGTVLVEAVMRPAAFTDIWRRGSSGSGDEAACATYQSTLEVTQWGDLTASPFLGQLRAAASDGLLSIKFNVDGYSMSRTLGGVPNPRFTRGRIVGTLGVATPVEPAHTVVGRHFGSEVGPLGEAFPSFRPTSGVNYCPALVDTAARKVRLDLGNALPAAVAGGAPQDIGDLLLRCRADDGTDSELASVDYRGAAWYETTAGVVDLPADRTLTDEELAAVAAGRLRLVTRRSGQERVVTEEALVHVRADEFVARLDPGDEWTVRLHVTQRGEPLPGARVNLFLLTPRDPDAAADFPVGGLTVPASADTGADGIAEATLVAADPGDPRFFYFSEDALRVHVDGQVYRIGYAVDGVPQPNPSNLLSVLVWNTFVPDDPPTWHGSMRDVLVQYGDLYPWMTRFGPQLDMALYDSIADQRQDILDVLELSVTDSGYMPVSRDMSGSRRAALVAWLTDLGPDGKPLLGVEQPVTADREAPAAARRKVPDADLGGKTAAGERVSITPR